MCHRAGQASKCSCLVQFAHSKREGDEVARHLHQTDTEIQTDRHRDRNPNQDSLSFFPHNWKQTQRGVSGVSGSGHSDNVTGHLSLRLRSALICVSFTLWVAEPKCSKQPILKFPTVANSAENKTPFPQEIRERPSADGTGSVSIE